MSFGSGGYSHPQRTVVSEFRVTARSFGLTRLQFISTRPSNLYDQWPSPTCIISDGPYGVSGFPGDEHKTDTLVEWYRPHVQAVV